MHLEKLGLRKSLRGLFLAGAMSLSTPTDAVAGTLVAWGAGSSGQLGNGNPVERVNTPVYVSNLSSDVTASAAGAVHGLAVDNGAAKAWGSNTFGSLGNGTNIASNVPVDVSGLSTGVTAVAAGSSHSLAIQNGAAKAWGMGWDGQLGAGETNSAPTPVNVTGLSSGVTAVAAGTFHSLAIQNGGVKAWGYGASGRLGNGSTSGSNVPINVVGLSSGVTDISAGAQHNLAIQNGAAVAWGFGGNGRLGNGSTADSSVPVSVTGLSSGVTDVAAGIYHSLAIQNGNVYAWGSDNNSALGNGGTWIDSSVPVMVLDLPVNLVSVAAGEWSSYALAADGNLYAWGYNIFGQLGLGDYIERSVPTLVPAPAGYIYTSISSRNNYVSAIIAPVPEPSTIVLAGVGLAGLAVYGARRRRG